MINSPCVNPAHLTEYERQADAELWGEAKADWLRRVRERSQRVGGEAMRAAAAVPAADPRRATKEGRRAILDEKKALFAHLTGKPGVVRSAAEDRTLDLLRQEIYALEKHCMADGTAGTIHVWPPAATETAA